MDDSKKFQNKRRVEIFKELRKASRAKTPHIKNQLPQGKIDLIKATHTLKERGIKLFWVACYIEEAERGRRDHADLISRSGEAAKLEKHTKRLFHEKFKRLTDKFPGTDSLLELYLAQAKNNPNDPAARWFKASAKKTEIQAIRTRLQRGRKTDKPIERHIEKFCKQMNQLFGGEPDFRAIANLCNAFQLSDKIQTYHTVHNRLKKL